MLIKGRQHKTHVLLCLNLKTTMRSKNIQHCSTPYYYLQQTLNKSFIITVFLMPLDCRNQLTGTGRAEWCLLIYWGLFVVTNICSGFVTSTTGAPGSVWAWHELLSPHPGSEWPGEGEVCSLTTEERVLWLLWGWDWDWMLPGVPAWRHSDDFTTRLPTHSPDLHQSSHHSSSHQRHFCGSHSHVTLYVTLTW